MHEYGFAFRIEQPPTLTVNSSIEARRGFEWWDHSKGLILMIMKCAIPKTLKDDAFEETYAKLFQDIIEKRFEKNKKGWDKHTFSKAYFNEVKGNRNIQEYIMESLILLQN